MLAINKHWWYFAQHLVFFVLAAASTWNWLRASRPALTTSEERS